MFLPNFCPIFFNKPRAGKPEPELELGARELGFFEGCGALFSDVGGAGAGAIKVFGSSSFYPIIEKCSCSIVILLIFQMHFNFMFTDLSVYLKTIAIL